MCYFNDENKENIYIYFVYLLKNIYFVNISAKQKQLFYNSFILLGSECIDVADSIGISIYANFLFFPLVF